MSANTPQTNERNSVDFENADVPLLEEHRTIVSRPTWRGPALTMGLLVGTAVQLATVGITTLIIATLGAEALQHSKLSIVGLPIIYNTVTLLFIWATLAVLRTVLTSAHRMGRQSSEQKDSDDDKHFKASLSQFEGHFVLGAVFGAGMLWLAVDLLMGVNSRMFFALLPLNAILFVYMLLGFISDLAKDEPEEEDDEATCIIRSTGGSRYRNGPYDV